MVQENVKLHDLVFQPFISAAEIESVVQRMAKTISEAYAGEVPVILGVLNGSLMFLADLIRNMEGACEIDFIKLKSYEGTNSTEKVNELIGCGNLRGKKVLVVEDIVDTGNTLEVLVDLLHKKEVADLKIATLFLKPEVYKKAHKIDYVGVEIPNKFIVGYGMDYNELGRNIPGVYQLKA